MIVSGSLSQYDTPIPLTGWSIEEGYLHREPADAISLMSPIVDDLIIIKDEAGSVYWPEFALNNIGNMLPGKGHQIKTDNDVIFSYPNIESGRVGFKDYTDFISLKYHKPLNTGNNMTIAIPDNVWLEKPSIGDEVIVLDREGLIVGNDRYREEGTVITIWGDDELTEEKDGLQIGEKFSIKLLRADVNIEEGIDILSWQEGNGLYSVNGISIAGSLSQNIVQEKQLVKITDLLGRGVSHDVKKSTVCISMMMVLFRKDIQLSSFTIFR